MNKTPVLDAHSRRWLLVAMATLAVLVMTFAFTSVSRAQSITLLPGFNDTVVTSSLRYPTTAMAFAPDGRLFIAEGHVANANPTTNPTIGAVRVIKDGVLLPTRFATVEVRAEIERGLTGIAIDPNFATNQYVYVRYTAGSVIADPPTCRHIISRFTAEGDVAAPNSQVLIADLGDCLGNGFHNAGALHFGIDGKLYTAIGDQNSCSSCAQSLESIFGKLLRFNPDGTIPTDNPFYNSTTGINRSIWAMGLRNPFNFAVQPGTGRIHINDVGGKAWEEINVGQAGANYGWPTCESACSPPNPTFTDPLYAYNHDAGCAAITGGVFYNPTTPSFPDEYIGKYFFLDWCRDWIKVLDPATGEVTDFASNLLDPSTALAVGPEGALYVLGNKSVHKIQYTNRPAISQQPISVTVNVGEVASFAVVASGNPPLSYQWQRNGVDIPGATSSTYSLTATLADNGSTFRSVVTNASGSTTSEAALLTVRTTANQPPVGTIAVPGPDTFYRAGDTITFSGSATDPEEGDLPVSALSWVINLHHNVHFHDYIGPLTGVAGGSFTLPIEDETDDNVWYRINLTVTDADGSTHTSYRDVMPLKSTLTVATEPPGLQVTLEGQPVVGPHSTLSVEGLQRTLGVVSPQTLNGVIYEWVSWSDGGAATHTLLTPIEDATYTAVYRPSTESDLIFADSFEASNLSAWTSRSTDGGNLSVNDVAALVGIRGMSALINDNNMLSVVDDWPNAEKRYRARFHFDPNSIVMAHNDNHKLFRGFAGTSLAVLSLDLRFYNNKYQVRTAILNDSSTWHNSTWLEITDAPHAFEVDWQAASPPDANNGSLTLWIDGVQRSQLTGIDNDTRQIDRIRLGAISDIDTGTRGSYYFDAFESRRQSYIGPATGAATSTITLATDPPGLQITLDGQAVTAPHSAVSEEGQQRALGVVSPQTVGGITYEWVSWSDGGAANHNFTVPTNDQTYTAQFQQVVTEPPPTPTSTITLATDPPGLQVTLDGQAVTAPHSTVSEEGQQRALDVVSPQTVDGITYAWVSWSDGGAASHNITVPTNDQTYTAQFEQLVVADDLIFADDFESGNLSAWPQRVIDGGDLAALPAAALEGTYGLRAQIDDNKNLALIHGELNGEKRYRARFHFDPNSIVMAHNNNHEIFRGFVGTWPAVLDMKLRFYNGKYQVRVGILNDSTTMRNSAWFELTDAPHALEVDWQAATAPGANNGSLSFWIDGVQRSQLTGIDNDTRQIDRIRLGAISGLDSGTRGSYFFDAFESRREHYIGPAAGVTIAASEAADPAALHAYTEEELTAEDLQPPADETPLEETPSEETPVEEEPVEETPVEEGTPQLFLPWMNR